MLFHIFLNRDRERMHRVLLCRRREQDDFLLLHACRRADERNLRHADRQRPCLVQHNRIRAGQRLDVVAPLDEDAALGRSCNRRRHRRRRRELQPAGKIDKEQVQHPPPVARCPVDNRCAEEGHGHEVVGHLIGEVLHGRAARLRLLDEMDNVRERGIAAHLLHRNDELARLNYAARIDRCALALHRRRGFARDGCLRHRRITAQDAPVDDNLFPCVHGNRVAGADLLHGHLPLNLAVGRLFDKPDIALSERKQPRNMRAGFLRCIACQHLRTVAECEEHEARLRFSREHRGNDRRRCQCVGIRLAVADQPADPRLDKVARDAEHKQGAQDLNRGKDLRRAAPQELHRRKARKRDHGIAAELRHLLRRRHRLLRRLAHRTRRRRTNARRRNRALMPEIDTPLPHGCRRHRRKTAHACRKAQRICARQICMQTDPRMRQLHTLHPLISVSAHQSICEPGGVLFDRTS